MVNLKIDYFRKKINESNLSHGEFELVTDYSGGAGYAVQEIRRRLRVGEKTNTKQTNKISTEIFDPHHHSNKRRNSAKIM